MTKTITELNKLSLPKLGKLFYSLPHIDTKELYQVYRAEFIGPLWLRGTAGPILSLTGLHGWWGKVFFEDNTAYNLLETDSSITRKIQMQVRMAPSPFDGKNTAQLTYRSDAPVPWRYVTDELRRLDEIRILAMTYMNRQALYKIAFPFILTQQEKSP